MIRNFNGKRQIFGLFVMVMMIAVGFSPTQMLAQSTTDGAIGGTITDQSGAVVARATVTARNLGTNATGTATSDSSGGYRVVHLQPGPYDVEVTAGNFSAYKQTSLTVEVGRITNVDAKLGVAGKAETVQVSAEAPVVNTEQQDFSTNINQTSINELPINGRRWSNFAVLTPGVVPDGNFGLLSFRGISGLLNNNTVDGGDHNQAFFSEEVGRTRMSYSISQDSIREFQVNTSNYSAEYGRAAGGVVNAVTKSGTNSFHGSAFYFNRDNNLGATNPFTTAAVNQGGVFVIQHIKPKDKRHQYGVSIGGPIIKDKLFFFFSYDQQKRNFPGVAIPNSPTTFLAPATAAELATLTTRLGAAAAPTAATNGLTLIQSLTGTVPRRGDQIIFLPKIDWHVNDKNTFSAVYNRTRWTSPAGIQTQATNNLGIRSFGDDLVHDDSVTGKLISLLSSHISNEARFTYSRDNEFEITQSPAPGEFLTGPGGSSVDVFISNAGGSFEFGKPTFLNRRALPDETRYQYFDAASIAWGKHLFKIGGDINHVNDLEDNLRNEGGSYSYNTRVDFFTDMYAFQNNVVNPAKVCNSNATAVGHCYSSYAQGFGPTAFEFQTNDYNFFAQDDWRVLPRLTLNLGLRYEYEKLPSPQLANPLLPNTGIFPSKKNNFGPRIGFAWDVYGGGKTALRGGYGIYYGRVINSTIANAITNTGLSTGQIQVTPSASTAGSPTFPFTLPAGSSPGGGNVVEFNPNFKNPLIHQADLVLEQQIGTNMVFSASYLLSLGRHLPNFVDTNLNAPTTILPYTISGGPFGGQVVTSPIFTGARPNAAFGAITDIISNVNSSYNAAVVQLNRRLTRGLQFQTNYTWSHAIDQGQSSATFTGTNFPQNPLNQAAEKGNSNFDVRNRFVASIVWTADWNSQNWFARWLVNGFELAPVFIASSGHPISDNSGVSGSLSAPLTNRTTTGLLGDNGSNRPFFFQRNTLIGPGLQNLDLRAAKNFKMGERFRLQVSAEAFNLFNHEIFSSTSTHQYSLTQVTATLPNGPTGNCSTQAAGLPIGTNILCYDPTVNTPNGAQSTLYRERNVQLGARITF